MFEDKIILITGGTGSLGRKLVKKFCGEYNCKKVIVFSRDEYKQSQMAAEFDYPNLRFFLGDVRDRCRLRRAFACVDYVIHAAALKQIPALEYNPTEAVETNINGTINVIEAAIDSEVKIVVLVSTDKAVNPINLYGATKLVAEKLFCAANAYAGNTTKFCSVRYGNVLNSRGSVIELFRNLKKAGQKEFPITDPNMTRFWLTLDEAVDLVISAIERTNGSEIFVPRIPSMRILDLARAIEPNCEFKFTGIRAGEKLHETLISMEDCKKVILLDGEATCELPIANLCSNTNDLWLEKADLKAKLK